MLMLWRSRAADSLLAVVGIMLKRKVIVSGLATEEPMESSRHVPGLIGRILPDLALLPLHEAVELSSDFFDDVLIEVKFERLSHKALQNFVLLEFFYWLRYSSQCIGPTSS